MEKTLKNIFRGIVLGVGTLVLLNCGKGYSFQDKINQAISEQNEMNNRINTSIQAIRKYKAQRKVAHSNWLNQLGAYDNYKTKEYLNGIEKGVSEFQTNYNNFIKRVEENQKRWAE